MKGTLWSKLVLIGQKQGSIKLKDLSLELKLDEDETLNFIRQVFPEGLGAEIFFQDEECWVDLNGEAMQYMLPLSPSEWMKLNEILSAAKGKDAVLNSLKKKVLENGPIRIMMELLHDLEFWDHKEETLLKFLDQAILDKKAIKFNHQQKQFSAFPWKVLHLEGNLSLILEDCEDHCLMVLPVKDIKNCEEAVSVNSSRVTSFEVEEFIRALRSMGEKETRLILKIHDPKEVNLFPDYHFLGKPCMITNPNGDLIWAAYVEACEPLYEWLMSLGDKVEILDPVRFREEYLSYCEEKFRKIA